MKNKSPKKQIIEKGFFRKAGEVIGTIGHEIAEGKDKVIAASHNIIGGITGAAKEVQKKPAKKGTLKKIVAKKAPAKTVKKLAKKASKKRGVIKESKK